MIIKLNPVYRVGKAPDAIFLMNEYFVHRLEISYLSIIDRLINGVDASTLNEEDLLFLKYLYEIDVLRSNDKSNFVDFINATTGMRVDYIESQLAYTKVKVINRHVDDYYSSKIIDALKEAKVDVVDDNQTLTIYVVDRITKLSECDYPALLVKVGSYRPTIGPLLTPLLKVEDLNSKILPGKAFFETETFLENLPSYLKELQANLVTNEILNFIIKVGSHAAIDKMVDWDLSTMSRNVWTI